jgi:predicted nucleotidyltransferase
MAKLRDQKLKKIVDVLKKEFKPRRIFLFGSRANGSARPESDYDLVLVVSELRSRHSAEVKARSLLLNSCGISADIFIYDESDFDEWKDELSSIPETALNTGRDILAK